MSAGSGAATGREGPEVPGDDRGARAVWTALVEPGDEVAGALVEVCGPVDALRWVAETARRPSAEVDVVAGAGPGGVVQDPALRRRLSTALRRWCTRWPTLEPERDLEAARRCGARLVVPGDEDWPPGLADLGTAAPAGVWVRGAGPVGGPAVALVGARASTTYGERVAVDLATDLARRGWAVVSGGAYGIDAAAHRGALLGGGPTVVVLAGGVERPYPAGHARLLDQVLEGGGTVLAESPPGSVPTRSRFLQRNRLIAALSDATVVVEAAWRSGAASTAHHAARLLRPVGAVPGPVTSPASAGCHRLLRDGVAVCVTDTAEVVELAGRTGAATAAPAHVEDVRPGDDLDPLSQRVRDGLRRTGVLDVPQVAARAGTTVGEARAALGLLELDGLAVRRGSGWVLAGDPVADADGPGCPG